MAPNTDVEEKQYRLCKHKAENVQSSPPHKRVKFLKQQAPFLPTLTGASRQDLHTSPLVEGVYQNQKCASPRHETDMTILRGSQQLHDETTPIYYRINAFLYTQLEIDHFCESISRAKAAHMKHVSLRVRSDFTGTSHKLQRLECLIVLVAGTGMLESDDFSRSLSQIQCVRAGS
jgi:hypothetical protein